MGKLIAVLFSVSIVTAGFAAGSASTPQAQDPVSTYDPEACWDAPPIAYQCWLVGRVCPFNGLCYLIPEIAECDCP